MADLRTTFAGIKSPNPFWLASAPPTDKAYNVVRAFKAGWGGVVWKTLGEDGPPIVNVTPRATAALEVNGQRMIGFNNIELITDRPLQINLDEIKQVKRDWPDRALIVSLMVPCEERSWKTILPRVEDTGCDGVELNFGCPHGMSERGMGSAVGQVPEYVEMVTRWCKQYTRMPVHREADAQRHRHPGPGARREAGRRRRGVADQHHQLDHRRRSRPHVAAAGGRRQGLARRLLRAGGEADRAATWWPRSRAMPRCAGLPISGIGGIATWRDAAEFIALGAGNVQVCTAAMHLRLQDRRGPGRRPVQLARRARAMPRVGGIVGRAVPNVTDWKHLNLNHTTVAAIDQDLCIQCGRCHIVCEDTSHQAIAASTQDGERHFEVIDAGMRRLQPVRLCLSGAGLHHHESMRRPTDKRTGHLARASTPTGPRIRTTRAA